MKINGEPTRTIRLHPDNPRVVQVIDQRQLPHQLTWMDLSSVDEAAYAIKDMVVRGAPLIGATAAMGMYLAALDASEPDFRDVLTQAAHALGQTRPTAVNLHWALTSQMETLGQVATASEAIARLRQNAEAILDADEEQCRQIGLHGVQLIEDIYARTGQPVNILTHCNAGWLACVDWGTATSPIYHAHDRGLPVHVWVDETRPRNQGAKLTAWELGQHGVPHTVIPDNAGGHLMQHGLVNLAIVGTDRTTRQGDVANKIGTYLKALAAHDNGVPFYVALPSSTIDWTLGDGVKEIPIEQRSQDEVKYIDGLSPHGVTSVLICPESSPAANYGFDVTPARLVTGLITERGICPASEAGLLSLFPEAA
ncbi:MULTISPECIES: S-methyl-5-thioribose-1-phosphate isomerase [Cyanophyceae]|uniref:S-methyl-5-thioribose-1-phosphate isomerase n=1 Tax=Cyanophyceae TaxID=3028117 RepID=UPI0016864B13|nr:MULTISPECIES: S-methyl-5-thioribose-1-phosphate isomerase [Cyanophyceae]MBD1915879.1 S-methyl-5-thioribose-1-phosphate isomerase [Phormidium sp. FACHB-77]MBD2030447.1 S-methyl-5-thioribose-1-phosphate isomerase [Phormidium sp. FACHB-322]MBD2053449.1 S-methyl-5-thioribose-1-phosphate isomerase [Leptolyngbya sp. FACHB-60]